MTCPFTTPPPQTITTSRQLDGAIARRFPSQQSILGTVIDPFADKFLIVCGAACLGYIGAMPGCCSRVRVRV